MKINAVFILALALMSSRVHAAEVIDLGMDNPQISMISASGLIDENMTRGLERVFRANLQSNRRTAILFSSNGGRIESNSLAADVIINFADQFYAKNKTTTVLIVQQECSSACTMFLAFLHRFSNSQSLEIVLANETELYFHGPREQRDGHFVSMARGHSFEVYRSTVYAAYLNSGVNPKWLRANHELFDNPNAERMFLGRDICSSGSNIVDPKACQPIENLFERTEQVLAGRGRLQALPSRWNFPFFN
jgi:hypothetical protein